MDAPSPRCRRGPQGPDLERAQSFSKLLSRGTLHDPDVADNVRLRPRAGRRRGARAAISGVEVICGFVHPRPSCAFSLEPQHKPLGSYGINRIPEQLVASSSTRCSKLQMASPAHRWGLGARVLQGRLPRAGGGGHRGSRGLQCRVNELQAVGAAPNVQSTLYIRFTQSRQRPRTSISE